MQKALELGDMLTPEQRNAGRKGVRRSAADGVDAGVESGLKALVVSLVVGAPTAIVEAILWLTGQGSWVGAALKFVVGIVTGA